jgi:cardiolipin synthase A/B
MESHSPNHTYEAGARTPLHRVVGANHVTIIDHGPDMRAALLDLIDGAHRSLRLLYYIFADDESGARVRDALVRACGRGVDVVLMVDAFGSSDTSDSFFVPLREAGGKVAWFGAGWSTRYLIRNHQKIAIADDGRAMIGGFNVADSYFSLDPKVRWQDLGLVLEGDQVEPLACWYGLLWQWMGSERRFLKLRALVRNWQPESGPFSWLVGGPTSRLSPWARRVRSDLRTAHRVDMVAAYFSPGQHMLRRLANVALRARRASEGKGEGGTRLILAAKSDNGATIAASRLLYGPLTRRGVAIYEYQPSKLHMKLIVIDDAVYVGSANFDMRSLFINLELMLRIEDAGFAADMRAYINQQTRDSESISPALLQSRKSRWRLLKGWASYFLVSVLDYTVTRSLNFAEPEEDE